MEAEHSVDAAATRSGFVGRARDIDGQPAPGRRCSPSSSSSSSSSPSRRWLNSYWLLVMTGVVIYSIITLGLGVLIGRVGMVSLCQFVLAGIGAWVALRLSYATDLPFPLLVSSAGLVTAAIGTLIGLPALRLSGLYLALITLMAAGALTILLRTAQFPNGGGGFFGNSSAGGAIVAAAPAVDRQESDVAYYRYCVVVASLMFAVAAWHVRRKPGRAWAAMRQSESQRGGGGRQHHPLQAVGVRAGLVLRRRRRRAAGGRGGRGQPSTSSRCRTRSPSSPWCSWAASTTCWGAVVAARVPPPRARAARHTGACRPRS